VALRTQLDQLIRKNKGNNWWKPKLFNNTTAHLLPQRLQIILPPPIEKQNYNCFIYALGLPHDKSILKNCKGFIYDTFFQKLIDAKELQIIKKASDGDYVVYRDSKKYPDMLTHIGIMKGSKVISKWAWGPLLKHDIFDVPKSYGDDIFFVRSVSLVTAKRLYWRYKQFNTIPPL
jgi:hypothetical protein